jgi:hypothetical protein
MMDEISPTTGDYTHKLTIKEAELESRTASQTHRI